MTLWSFLPPHGSVCLAYAPVWYVPTLSAMLLMTVIAYLAISTVLFRHSIIRKLQFARQMSLVYAVFVLSCGAAHAWMVVTLYIGGKAYLVLLAVVSVMAITSAAAAVLTMKVYQRAERIGRAIDRGIDG